MPDWINKAWNVVRAAVVVIEAVIVLVAAATSLPEALA